MKVIAFYLPQFHNIPENDEWWGDGFTEWANVKKARSLFEGHKQPKKPLNDNYYDLLDDSVKKWQVEIAKKYGLYGFCYYHYWFNGKLLLEQPMEQMLKNKEIDFPFCISWANEPWTKAWVNENKPLIPQFYGGKSEWKQHFDYLLPFFCDSRYIKEDNKPLFVIYRPEVIGCLNEMLDYWDELAKESGFDGMVFAHQYLGLDQIKGDDSRFKYDIEFQPVYAEVFNGNHASRVKKTKLWNVIRRIKRVLFTKVEGIAGVDLDRVASDVLSSTNKINTFSYDDRWDDILTMSPISKKSLPGAFVDWDNSPRKDERGKICVGASPEKFKEYMKRQIERAKNEYHSQYIFITAWNEWAEGSFLEPDQFWQYGYLEALYDALKETNELPPNAKVHSVQ